MIYTSGPHLFGTRKQFHGRQFFFHGSGGGLERTVSGWFKCITLIIRFSKGVCSPMQDPSHAQFTIGFERPWESNVTADLTGSRAQAIMLTRPLWLLLLPGQIPNRPRTNTMVYITYNAVLSDTFSLFLCLPLS